MTLRRLQNTHILPMITLDRSLSPIDHRVHGYLYHNPLQSIRSLQQALGYSREAMRLSLNRLVAAGWARSFTPPHRTRGQIFKAATPPAVQRQLAALLAQRRTSVQYLGEWLMRCTLDCVVCDYKYHDDAFPPWLVTAEDVSLQLDRWYEFANVAFEFQGPQHFQTSNRYVRTAAELARRRKYDGEKIRLCALQKVELIELLPEDLGYHRLRSKLDGKIPLLPVIEGGPVLRELAGFHNHLMKHMRKYT